jgi:excisionase family DNA binding protein
LTLKVKAAAEYLGLHEQTLLERVRAGKIPGATA